MEHFSQFTVYRNVSAYLNQEGPWLAANGAFKVEESDIGKTVVFCPVCDYKEVLASGAVPVFCPANKCGGVLNFIDVTPELFYE